MAFKKYYFAARYSRHPEMQDYAKQLAGLDGSGIISRWIWGNHEVPEGTLSGDRLVKSVKFAIEDYEDVCEATHIIIFTDPPRTKTRGGKHVELGLALAQNKTIYMVGKEYENIFYYLPQVRRFDTFQQLMNFLVEEKESEIVSKSL